MKIDCNQCGKLFEWNGSAENPLGDLPTLAINRPKHIPGFEGMLHLNVCPDCYTSFEEWWHTEGRPV